MSLLFRIPRYVLLLTDMRKYTNQRHIDYEDLSAVVDEIKTILETINSKMSQHQTLGLAKLIYVLDVIDGVDLSVSLPSAFFSVPSLLFQV
jgi:hypothetical protein